MRKRSHGYFGILTLAIAFLHCGTDGTGIGMIDATSGDAARDGASDASKADTGSAPSSADTGIDTGIDTGADAGLDTGIDAGADSGVVLRADAAADAAIDTGADSDVDASIDAAVDAAIDAAADSGADAGAAVDAAIDAGAPTYNDLTDETQWSFFDTATLAAGTADFVGAGFDGRYLYLVPGYTGPIASVVARYDTSGTFTATPSWSTFDTTALDAHAAGFAGAGFDGRYLYLVPHYDGSFEGIVARYDTSATFTATPAWSTFDTTTVDPGAIGFLGASFDGRYLYFLPDYNNSASGLAIRYDTTSSYTATASWTTFDTSRIDPGARGFAGAGFDGRYLYLTPYNDSMGTFDGLLVRYDTAASFTATSSWGTFDTTRLNANARGFFGAGFDGRYLYLVPYYDDPTYSSTATRYDTAASFTATASWSTFDTRSIAAGASGFVGASFDGRYLYLAPSYNGAPDGIVVRYDTTASFTATTSWSSFDTTTQNSSARGFFGAGFDGRYVYLVPNATGVVARFDATRPASMPRLCSSAAALHCFSGSFF
jgi:hypothetical protein